MFGHLQTGTLVVSGIYQPKNRLNGIALMESSDRQPKHAQQGQGTATISPAAGTHMMNDGLLAVTLSGNAATWGAGNSATVLAKPTTDNNGLFITCANDSWVISFT